MIAVKGHGAKGKRLSTIPITRVKMLEPLPEPEEEQEEVPETVSNEENDSEEARAAEDDTKSKDVPEKEPAEKKKLSGDESQENKEDPGKGQIELEF